MATTTLKTLKTAADYKVISEETFEFNFNEFRGGSFSETLPKQVIAFGSTWDVSLVWIDRGWGDYKYTYSTQEKNNFTELIKNGVTILAASANELAILPIDWVDVLEGFSGIRDYGHGYNGGSECTIIVCNKYITIEGAFAGNSTKQMRGYVNERPVARFTKAGKDVTQQYIKEYKRKRFESYIQELQDKGLTYTQARKFASAKARWKHEVDLQETLAWLEKQPNKNVWEAIANAESNRKVAQLTKKFLKEEFSRGSHPRTTEYASLIAQLCDYSSPIDSNIKPFPTQGEGWKLISF